jgi:hypothetical protein
VTYIISRNRLALRSIAKWRILPFLFAATAFAQSGDFSKLPNYLVSAGAEANPGGVLVSLAKRIGQTDFYSWSTLDTPLRQTSGQQQILSSVRTGAAYVAAKSGSCFLFFLTDTGIAAASSVTLGAFSAGGGVYCSSKRFPGLYYGPVVRVVKVSSVGVAASPELMVSWSF